MLINASWYYEDKDDDIDKFNTAMEEQGLAKLKTYIPLDVDPKTFDGVP